jgi:hypothetical protein
MNKYISTGALAALTLCGTASADNLIQNGDFEAPGRDLDGWVTRGTVAEYDGTFYVGAEPDLVAFNSGQTGAGGGIFQVFTATAGRYSLTFDFGNWGGGAPAGDTLSRLQVEVFGTTDRVFGTIVADAALANGVWDGYGNYTFDVDIMQAGQFSLLFTDISLNTANADALLDNVSFVRSGDVPGTGIPTPAAAGLAGVGMAGLAARRRRDA